MSLRIGTEITLCTKNYFMLENIDKTCYILASMLYPLDPKKVDYMVKTGNLSVTE